VVRTGVHHSPQRQINLPLLMLVLADFARPRSRWRGVGIGLAAGLKVTPVIFIGYLFLHA
jgi:alpha-1,2-mannosyltransferase